MKTSPQLKTPSQKLLIPFLVFITGLILTGFAWYEVTVMAYSEKERSFNDIIAKSDIYIRSGINGYTNILYGARGLFAASAEVDRREWNAYINSLSIKENFPGMQAISYVSLVPLEDKESFIKEVQDDASLRAEGYPDFNIRPEGDRKEYYVVTYIEPFEGNEAAFGFDLFSNPARRAALEEARDINSPIATAPIRLVQEKGEQAGFLIFLPVYKNGMPIETVEERQEALIGFISAVFRADDLFTSFLNTFPEFSNVHLEVVDLLAQKTREENFLIFNKYDEAYSDYKFTAQKNMSVGGREWMLSFYELPGLVKSAGTERYIPVAVILAGSLLSMLLFLILYLFSSTRQKAILIAKDITKENEATRRKIEERTAELERANNLMTGRESRIAELKEENERLRMGKGVKNKLKNNESDFYDSNI